jgi:hypothetical protein
MHIVTSHNVICSDFSFTVGHCSEELSYVIKLTFSGGPRNGLKDMQFTTVKTIFSWTRKEASQKIWQFCRVRQLLTLLGLPLGGLDGRLGGVGVGVRRLSAVVVRGGRLRGLELGDHAERARRGLDVALLEAVRVGRVVLAHERDDLGRAARVGGVLLVHLGARLVVVAAPAVLRAADGHVRRVGRDAAEPVAAGRVTAVENERVRAANCSVTTSDVFGLFFVSTS